MAKYAALLQPPRKSARPPDASMLAGKLRPLGYERYSEYLASPHWIEMRCKFLHGKRCECGAHATQLHHLSYVRLGQEWPSDLEPVCERCHCGRHSMRPPRRWTREKKPLRGPETVPPETPFETTLRRLEQL